MRVSIAMATYNGAAFLQEQLQSFVEQSWPPDELVICDDGSSDGTVAIAETFAAAAPFHVFIERNAQNLGYSANFSKAASMCTGEIIFLSDQDDRWFADKIAKCLAAFGSGTHVVLNDQEILHADGKVCGTVLGNMRALGFSDSMFVAGCCTAMTRTFAQLALPFAGEMAFDHWVSFLAELLDARLVIDEPLQLYRRHGGNTSQSVFARRRPTKLDLWSRHGLSNPRPAWNEQIAIRDCFADRLHNRRSVAIALSSAETVDEALARLDREKASFEWRLAVLAHSRWTRPIHVLRHWRQSDYGEFEGWQSACKDLVRP